MSNIIVPLLTSFNAKGIQEAEKSLGSLGNSLKSLGRMAATAFGGVSLGYMAGNFMKSAALDAIEYQRAQNGMLTVYGKLTPQVQKFVDQSQLIGLTYKDAARALTNTGAMFKNVGMPMEQVASHTEHVVALASDLASTYGSTVDDALFAVGAAFRGQYRPLERFGIALSANQVKAQMAADGLDKLKGQALMAATQQERYTLIMKYSADAHGAFSRQVNSLFEQQQLLMVGWENMKTKLGEILIPALTKVFVALQPIGERLFPILQQGFGAFAQGIVDLLPAMETLINDVMALVQSLSPLISIVVTVFSALINNITTLLPLIAILLGGLGAMTIIPKIAAMVEMLATVYGTLAIDAQLAGVSIWEVAIASLATPWGAIAAGIGLIAGAWLLAATGAKAYNDTTSGISGLSKKQQDRAHHYAQQQADAAYKYAVGLQGSPNEVDPNFAKKSAYDRALMDWWNRYQKQHTTANALGNVPNMLKDSMSSIKDWLSSMGLGSGASTTTKGGKAFDFSGLINDFGNLFPQSLAEATRSMGQFEKAATSASDTLKNDLVKAVNAGNISVTQFNKLYSYASAESAILEKLGKQRDEVVAKIDYAKKVYTQVADSIRSYGDVTASTSTQVTTSWKEVLNGVEVTVSNTVNAMTNNGVLGHYQDVVAKTKKFYDDLLALKNAGLNQNLFGQIVQAGVDTGSATAEAILQGGQTSVDSLNSMFTDLNKTTQQLGDLSASVMQDSGSQIMSSFIDGLSSQENALYEKAKNLADIFSKAFNTNVDLSAAIGNSQSNNLTSSITVGSKPKGAQSANQYVLNITAGMGTDAAELGKQIVNYIKKYERNNGAVWVAAN